MSMIKTLKTTDARSVFFTAFWLVVGSASVAQGSDRPPLGLVGDYFKRVSASDPLFRRMIDPVAFEVRASDQIAIPGSDETFTVTTPDATVATADAVVPSGINAFEEPFTPSDASVWRSGKACAPLCCVRPWWAHRSGIFADFLLLRPGSTDFIYAVEQTDPDPSVASPTGPVGIVAIPEQGGFRTGLTLASSDCSSLLLAYARWDGAAMSSIDANFPNVLDSHVVHPSVATSGAASLSASSYQQISFQTVDIAYRHLWRASNTTALNWLAGVRYGNIEERSSTDQTVQVATGLTNVATDIDFDGFGITGGLDFERYHCRSGMSLYGRSMLSLLAGEWAADYEQTNQLGGGVIANSIEDFRVTPVGEAELGLRYTCLGGCLRLHGGLLVMGWFDAMTTRSYIAGVRSGQIQDISETMTFSGLTTGVSWMF